MYNQGAQAANKRRSVRTYGASSAKSGRGRGQRQENIRLIQLVVCLALFLAIFLGKGALPQKLGQVRDDLLELISTDFDFRTALSNLGESLSGGETVLSELGQFCIEVFGAGPQKEPAEQVSFTPPKPAGLVSAELCFLSRSAEPSARTAHYANLSQFGLELTPPAPAPEEAEPVEDTVPPETPPAVPAAGTVIQVSDYSGQELPENYTMDLISLGELETMTPMLGHLNSGFGYRDHPISGKSALHSGVDIGGPLGEPISAFAAGTVEYTGENDSYGLYLQVDHGNGIKSFYAHCSELLVSKGQTVAMGDTVALVGTTGVSTGPHLHLELKYEKTHLNPSYYVDFLET